MSVRRLVVCFSVTIASATLVVGGCKSSNNANPHASQSAGTMTPATGQAAASVRSYLDAAAMQNPAVTRPFLVAGNSGDLADEFASNRLHGWMYNREMLRLYNEKIDMKSGKATVTARVVVQGGYPLAYMAAQRTFNLVAQDGVWKIASIDPPPQTR